VDAGTDDEGSDESTLMQEGEDDENSNELAIGDLPKEAKPHLVELYLSKERLCCTQTSPGISLAFSSLPCI
jgi:hypothetical protein